MAYLNESGETIACTVPTSAQIENFFSIWYVTLLPLVVLIAIFFVLKKYVKNKFFLIIYSILAILLYMYWIPFTFLGCA